MQRQVLGDFELAVLLAILHLGPGAYGVAIIDEITRRTGRRVAPAAVYVALRRLERKGLIASRREKAGQAPGQPRRYVRLRRRAIVLIRESRRLTERMWHGLDPALADA